MSPFARPVDAQQFILQKAYEHFRKHGKWPQAREFDVKYGDLLERVGGLELLTRQLGSERVTPANPQNPSDLLIVNLHGLAELPEAQEDIENLLRTTRLAARNYRESGAQLATISVGDLVKEEHLDEDSAKRAIHLFGSANVVNTGGGPDQYGVAHAIRRFADVKDLQDFLARADTELARRHAIAVLGASGPQPPSKEGTRKAESF